MKKVILKTNCIIISIAIVLLTIGNPKTANAADPDDASQASKILMGAAIVLAVTVIVIVIVKSSKKKKQKQQQQAYLQQQLHYTSPYSSLLVDYRLIPPNLKQDKDNLFAVKYLKDNSKTLHSPGRILYANLNSFFQGNDLEINILMLQKSVYITDLKLVENNNNNLCFYPISGIN